MITFHIYRGEILQVGVTRPESRIEVDSSTSMYHFPLLARLDVNLELNKTMQLPWGKNEMYTKSLLLSQSSSYENKKFILPDLHKKSRSRGSHGNAGIPITVNERNPFPAYIPAHTSFQSSVFILK